MFFWKKIIVSKYGEDEWGWVPKCVPKYRLLSLWRVISCFGEVSNVRGEVFNKSVGFRVGEGKNVRFWYDDWVGIGKFWSLFPRLFRVACNKESSVKDCYFWVGSKVS